MIKFLYSEFNEKQICNELKINQQEQTKAFEDIMNQYQILSKKSSKNYENLDQHKKALEQSKQKLNYEEIKLLKNQKDQLEKQFTSDSISIDKLERNLIILTESFNDQIERSNEERNLKEVIQKQCQTLEKETSDLLNTTSKQKDQICHLGQNCETLQENNEKLEQDKKSLQQENDYLLEKAKNSNQLTVDKMNEINDLNEQLNKKLKEFNLEKKQFQTEKKEFEEIATKKEQSYQQSNPSGQSQLTGNFTQDFFQLPTTISKSSNFHDFPDTLIKLQRKYHQNEIYDISTNLNGSLLGTCGGDRSLRLYDPITQLQKLQLSPFSRDQLYTCLSISHHTDLLIAGGTDNTASLISILNGKAKHSLTGHSAKINSVKFFTKEHALTGSQDRSLKFWDILKGYQVKSFSCESQVTTIDTFNCEPLIATGHNDGSLRIYSNREAKPLNIMKNVFDQQVTSVKLSNNNNLIVASSKEGTFLKCFDIRNNRQLQILSDDNYINSHEYAKIAFGPDDKTVISGNWDSSIIVWTINKVFCFYYCYQGRKVQVLQPGKDAAIICTHYHPISGHLYAGDSKGNLFIYH